MNYTGNLRKMTVSLAEKACYELVLNDTNVPLNQYIGRNIQLRYTGKINCVYCGTLIKRSYQQGYCFPCAKKLARCDFCILKPEKCHYHEGTCREPTWGK